MSLRPTHAQRPAEQPGAPPPTGPARQVREADGLEFPLRLTALWQRVETQPIRYTQSGQLFKRDQKRLEEDPCLAGPIADILHPLPEPVRLWQALAIRLGLLVPGNSKDELRAAPAGDWDAEHVLDPLAIARVWLDLDDWCECGTWADVVDPAPGPIRSALLDRLARTPAEQWIALDEISASLPPATPQTDPRPTRGRPDRRGSQRPSRGEPEAILLGPAYALGLVRAAEEDPSGRRLVQLTPRGRQLVDATPPPAPSLPLLDQFLLIQPNFEVIAYRQGLTPGRLGQLSRFARWDRSGAALELKLTAEDLHRGLQGGLTAEAIRTCLEAHSARPLPRNVAEALRSWSRTRERITFHAHSTLMEFGSPEDLEAALAAWPATEDEGDTPGPSRISDRLLLVEAEGAIPFRALRLAGSRDYRQPPERCVEAEPDGLTLSLDPARADLFAPAELSLFADERTEPATASGSLGRRRFRVTPASLARALGQGLTLPWLEEWFRSRVGGDVPPALRLVWMAASGAVRASLGRPTVLRVARPELLDGLLQHPRTRHLLGTVLGPTAVVVLPQSEEPLREALADLGIEAVATVDG